MGKHDLKFFASTLGGLAVLLGIGGHGVRLWMEQNPGAVLDPTNLESIAQLGIWTGTAIWMWALANLAKSRGYSAGWCIFGLMMIWPFVGLIPWFVLSLVQDRREDASDQLMTANRFVVPILDAGAVKVLYSSDALDRKTATEEYNGQYDPWASDPAELRRKSANSHVAPVVPGIVREAKHKW